MFTFKKRCSLTPFPTKTNTLQKLHQRKKEEEEEEEEERKCNVDLTRGGSKAKKSKN